MALVVADELHVRSAPGTGVDSKILPELITKGRELFIVAGPVTVSGYPWWQVLAIRRTSLTEGVPFGWIAGADRDGEVWLAPATLDCPVNPSIADLVRIGGAGALVCFGGRDIKVRAYRQQFCGDGMTDREGSPDWITGVFGGDALLDREADWGDETALEIYGRAQPSLRKSGTPYFSCGQEGTGWFDVTGHFDDPASNDCRMTLFDTGELAEEPALSITWCRETFVYTDLQPRTGPS